MTDADAALAALVARHGWAVVKVPEDDRGPAFAYTVGLFRTFQHPEVLVSGLEVEVLHELLNGIGALVRSGVRFEAGDSSDEVLEGFPVTFRTIPPEAFHTHLGAGTRFYAGEPFAALHCVWPDREGRFPWDAGVDAWVRWAQPALAGGPESVPSREPAV